MHAGRLSRAQLQAWVANRYYYQTRIPIKDALIVAKSEDPRFRRMWLHRIVDHDGAADGEGGLALWQRLGRAVGLDEDELSPPPRAAGRALRLRRLRRRSCATRRCRGGGLVADGVLRARPHAATHRRVGAALPVDRQRRARLLPRARAARPPRLPTRRSPSSCARRAPGRAQERCVAALIEEDGDPVAPARLREGGAPARAAPERARATTGPGCGWARLGAHRTSLVRGRWMPASPPPARLSAPNALRARHRPACRRQRRHLDEIAARVGHADDVARSCARSSSAGWWSPRHERGSAARRC